MPRDGFVETRDSGQRIKSGNVGRRCDPSQAVSFNAQIKIICIVDSNIINYNRSNSNRDNRFRSHLVWLSHVSSSKCVAVVSILKPNEPYRVN